MKKIIAPILLFLYFQTLAQKFISYKYEKETSEVTLNSYRYTHRNTQSRIVLKRKIANTIFVIDSAKSIMIIDGEKWEIFARQKYSCNLYANSTVLEFSFFDLDEKSDVEVLLTYMNGDVYRYYIKREKWTRPKF